MESTHTLVQTRSASHSAGVAERTGAELADLGIEAPPAADALVLGRYRLLERLGAGGFGVVWRARDELLHREVAVKRIALLPAGDGERASREALAAARLSHPAIVALYEACAVQDAFYLISELVHGPALSALISAHALEDERVLQIGVALADALAHAHARGVIHRDVKPQNVLVPHQPDQRALSVGALAGVAKLTDFGGACLAGQEVLTRSGETLGTLAYMAPEQCEGRPAEQASDLYSLALVLYEALSGVNPQRGPTPAATVRRIGGPLEPLGQRRRDLPHTLCQALDRALAPSSCDRGTLEELRLALEAAPEPTLKAAPEPTLEGTPQLDGWQARSARRARERSSAIDVPTSSRLDVPAWEAQPPRHGSAAPVPRASALQSPRRGRAAPAPAAPAPQREHGGIEQQAAPRAPRRTALPRRVSFACAVAAVAWQAWAGRPGAALLLLAALAPLAALPRGAGATWLGAALAPLLGLVGLAGAFPAFAGQVSQWRVRAGLGALGYWWLLLAEALLSRRLWLGPAAGIPQRAVWEGSLSITGTHVLAPLLSLGVLLGATVWAVGAMVLPWIARGRSAALDVVAITIWSAAMVAAAAAFDRGLSAGAVQASPRGALLGALFGGALAVGARALRGPV